MSEPFTSYAQNLEDVVLWRALGHVEGGVYVDVGANDPEVDSITKAFYDAGWSGIDVEPVPEFAERLRAARPRDVVAEVAVTDQDVDHVTVHTIPGTGLSSLLSEVVERHQEFDPVPVEVPARRLAEVVAESAFAGAEVHFLKVDVEGAEAQVLRSVDFGTWRPWVVVVEATAPRSQRPTHHEWESLLTDAGYRCCLFDGLSRYYVSPEHPEVAELLDHGACVFDEFVTVAQVKAAEQLRLLGEERHRVGEDLERARADLLHWRTLALVGWDATVTTTGGTTAELEALRRELVAVRATTSWRVTAPLRWAMTRARSLR